MHVAVVGGGIAGLAAAWYLRDTAQVTVLEGSPRLGGKLAVSPVAGVPVDEGAEALLLTRPEGAGLIAELGLDLVPAGTTSAAIWTRGAMRPLPRRQFMGVPAEIAELAESGVVSPSGIARASEDLTLPPTARDGDVPVGGYVAARFGAEVVDRLVDPLLGGVYAGRAADLSFDATMPALAAAAQRYPSLSEAARSLLPAAGSPAAGSPAAGSPAAGSPAAAGSPVPRRAVFGTVAGGLGVLPDLLAKLSGATVRTGAIVRALSRTTDGWLLTVGSAAAPEQVLADAVIVAVPARPASRLLTCAPAAAAALAEIEYASMAIVTLGYPEPAFPQVPRGSGYLVPAVDGNAVKAVTFATVKWPHLLDPAEPVHVVRCSIGRIGEEALLQRSDDELAAIAAADLAEATGVTGRPADFRVTRWGGALPQYTVGHLDRIRRVREAVADQPGLAVCGAAYDGVGIPACIATAHAAADRVAAHLRH